MDIKSLKDLIKNIPENFSIPEDDKITFFIEDKNSLIDLRKARWLYKELGLFFVYNITALSSENLRKKFYNVNIDFDNLKKGDYICKQISEIYAKALNLIGIKAVTVEHKQGYDINHVGTLFEISNGMQFYADLTLDLVNIKTGMQTHEFGKNQPENWKIQNNFGYDKKQWIQNYRKNIEILNNDEISKYIDIPTVGYKVGNMYTETFFKRLYMEMQNEQSVKQYILGLPEYTSIKCKKSLLLKYKFEFLLKNLNLKQLDYFTGRDYIKRAIPNVFIEEEQKCFRWFNTNRIVNNKTKEKEYAVWFLLKCDEKSFFYLYKEGIIPHSISKEEFYSIMENENWNIPQKDDENILEK